MATAAPDEQVLGRPFGHDQSPEAKRRLHHRLEPALERRVPADQMRQVEHAAHQAQHPEHDERPGHDPGRLVQVPALRSRRSGSRPGRSSP